MKKLILIFFIGFTFQTFSQVNDKIKKAFALRLIEEEILVIEDKYSKEILLDPNLVNVEVSFLGQYYSDIVFYDFKVGENKIDTNDNKLSIFFNSSSCNTYILAFNLDNNRSYRIKGFYGNDLLFLIKDIYEVDTERKNVKNIINELDNLDVNVDFKSIFNAIKKFDFNADCLKACSEPKEAHSRVK